MVWACCLMEPSEFSKGEIVVVMFLWVLGWCVGCLLSSYPCVSLSQHWKAKNKPKHRQHLKLGDSLKMAWVCCLMGPSEFSKGEIVVVMFLRVLGCVWIVFLAATHTSV